MIGLSASFRVKPELLTPLISQDRNYFIIYLVGLTIGPALFSAAIYLCLARIIAIYGHGLSWLAPKTITVLFCCCDLVSLILQAAGGALASLATTKPKGQTGVNIMIAGLSTQVVSTFIFCLVCAQLALACHRNPHRVNDNTSSLRRKGTFRFFLFSLGIATICILIRCSFRVAELQGGFSGRLANDQVLFMILDGAMIIIAVSLLTVSHPGPVLGRTWQDGNFVLCGGSRQYGEVFGSTPASPSGRELQDKTAMLQAREMS